MYDAVKRRVASEHSDAQRQFLGFDRDCAGTFGSLSRKRSASGTNNIGDFAFLGKLVYRTMVDAKLRRQRRANTNKLGPERQAGFGQRAAAEKNREREARFGIIQALSRLHPYHQWPDFVQAFYTDPGQRTEYHQFIAPSPFQAPRFDRLNQSPKDWSKLADSAWERHRNRFLRAFESWVRAGVDEEIGEKRVRSPGNRPPGEAKSRRRGANTPIDRRYEWAAKYLGRVPLKEIAGADAAVSTVGRVARAIIRSAGWSTQARNYKPSADARRIYEEFPKAKYHRTEPARIVQDSREEAALGDGWTDRPTGKQVK